MAIATNTKHDEKTVGGINAAALVTVAMPIYNNFENLMESIQSIVNQDYDNIEILLINDGSTDNSRMLCHSFANQFPFIRTIDIEHKGVSAARNVAIEMAKGEYIAFVDSDDFVAPNYVSTLMRIAAANLNCLPVCGMELRDSETKKFIEIRKYFDPNVRKYNSEFVGLYSSGLFSSPCNKLYRVKSIKAGSIRFDTHISTGEDLIFNLRYLRECRGFVVDNSPLYVYNVSEEGKLHAKHDKARFADLQHTSDVLIKSAKHFKCNRDAMHSISLKILDEYMHSLRLFCLSNYNTKETRKFIASIFKTKEFKFAIKAIGRSKESKAYKTVIQLQSPYFLMKYFERHRNG